MVTPFCPDPLMRSLFLVVLIALSTLPDPILAGDDVPQMVRGGGVVVLATRLPAEGQSLRFRVEMGTHGRDLSKHRFGDIVRIRDAAGKEYAPTAVQEHSGWEHHRVAILQFPPPDPGTTRVELLVRDVAGIRERVFRWDLHGAGAPGRNPPEAPSRMK